MRPNAGQSCYETYESYGDAKNQAPIKKINNDIEILQFWDDEILV